MNYGLLGEILTYWMLTAILFAFFVWPHIARRLDAWEYEAMVERQRKALELADEIEAARIIGLLDDEPCAFMDDYPREGAA